MTMTQSRPWSHASGKVILLGEHAVVYGVPALAVGISRGALARATPRDEGPSILRLDGLPVELRADDEERDLSRSFRAVLEASGVQGSFLVEARTDLPPGAGLGCSAALGVALARALDPGATAALTAERAMAWERVFHGNPSGVDTAVSAEGGCIYFERGRGFERVESATPLLLCVGHTGTISSTKSMVEAVARLRERRPEMVAKSFDAIRSLVRNARLAIEAGDVRALGQLMDLNQMLLSGLFLSTQEIERMCGLARDVGALGAKLTGAGGGGCVASLVENRDVAERVLHAWKEAGFEGFLAETTSGSRPADRAETPARGSVRDLGELERSP
ncbi:mevalonate kinase [Pendulispora rubella]|uniref:Mevalonate kinase n=1 Tax=Pendulispora rubella TaxID=2741070 RepID=A0ABZ2LFF3_9BACT